MKRLLALVLFSTILAPTVTAAVGTSVHEPPPLWFEMVLDDEQLVIRSSVMVVLMDKWIPSERADKLALTEEEALTAAKAIEEHFAGLDFVSVDGIPVAPVVRNVRIKQIQDHFITIDYFEFELVVGTKGLPRALRFYWKDFDIFPNWPLTQFAALFEHGRDEAYMKFTPEEPEFIWRPPAREAPERSPLDLAAIPKGVAVPVLTVAFAFGALLFLPLSFFFTIGHKTRWFAFLGLLAVAAATTSVLERRMDLPWLTDLTRPEPAEALATFEALHRNIYRSFDYDEESEIYDALARSVEGELLESIYVEIYEGLILREEGGAMCRIRSVDILESELSFPEDSADVFEVACRWRVRGRVGHFGHEHLRLTEYAADYTVRRSEDGWRIGDVTMREQKRIPIEEPEDSEDGE